MKRRGQSIALVILTVLKLPFVIYASNFALGGLRVALPEPHYIQSNNAVANLSIFGHLAAGALVTVLVPLQLITAFRRRMAWLHRWSGRLIVVAAILTAIGGLIYIPLRGTIGGMPMNIGFFTVCSFSWPLFKPSATRLQGALLIIAHGLCGFSGWRWVHGFTVSITGFGIWPLMAFGQTRNSQVALTWCKTLPSSFRTSSGWKYI